MEIKYRWFHKKSGKMVDWKMMLKECDRLSMLLSSEDWVVMPYTGVKDINGVEIYADDIVRDFDEGTIYQVVYCEDCCGFCWYDPFQADYIHPCDLYPDQVEILGSIHIPNGVDGKFKDIKWKV